MKDSLLKAYRAVGIAQMLMGAIAILFGIATLVAGGRVLLGSDPGYIVFRPLLVYNTIMGLAYVIAGAYILRRIVRGRYAAGAIVVANLLVLGGIVLVYRTGGGVATDSLQAMTIRTAVWLGLFLATSWLVWSRRAVKS